MGRRKTWREEKDEERDAPPRDPRRPWRLQWTQSGYSFQSSEQWATGAEAESERDRRLQRAVAERDLVLRDQGRTVHDAFSATIIKQLVMGVAHWNGRTWEPVAGTSKSEIHELVFDPPPKR